MNDEIKNLLNDLKQDMNNRLDKQDKILEQLVNLVSKNAERLERVENTVNRLEQNQPSDIMAMLDRMNVNMEQRDNEIQVLNKRVFKTESEIERLTKQ